MNIRLNPSDHAVRGLITATAQGRIVFRGSPKDMAQARGADVLHVHTLDAPVIAAACQKLGIAAQILK